MQYWFRVTAAIFVALIAIVVFLLGTWKGGVLAIVVGLVASLIADLILQKIVESND